MKPLFLRLKAFGPFSKEVEVSFDHVFDGGLFLIHGRTGAGKTSLLDGLCFSLFGRPSSEEREKDIRGLRSDIADSTTMTETELVFSIGTDTYRVHRIPTQATPKKRGEGLTEYKGSAELFRLQESVQELRAVLPDFSKLNWIPLAGKVEAVDEAIENLLGMNERQFRQVVVLPQGKFREFLSSTSSDRQVILEKLFQTDRFSKLQQFISNNARKSEAHFRDATQGLQSKLESLGLKDVIEIDIRLKDLQSQSQTVRSKLESARTTVEKLSQELNLAKEFERSQQRLETLKNDKASLERKSSEIESLKKQTTVSRLWMPFFQHQDQTVALEKKVSSRELAKAESQKSVRVLSEKKIENINKLQSLLNLKPSIQEMGLEVTRLRAVAVLLKDIEKSQAAVAADEAKNRKNRVQITELESQSLRFDGDRIRHIQLLVRIDEMKRNAESTELETEDLRVKGLELKFHHSEASRLAALLAPESPCPVCGSLEHPNPAKADSSNSEQVTEQQIRHQKQALEKLKSDFTERRARRSSKLEPLLKFAKANAAEKFNEPHSSDFDKQFELYEASTRAFESAVQMIEVSRTEISTREESLKLARETIETKLLSVPEGERNFDQVVARGKEMKQDLETREPEIKSLEKRVADTESELSRYNGMLHALDEELAALISDLEDAKSKQAMIRLEIEKSVRALYQDVNDPPVRTAENELRNAESEIEAYASQVLKVTAALAEVQQSIERVEATRTSDIVAKEFEMAQNTRTELEQSHARTTAELESITKLKGEAASSLEKLGVLKSEAERAARIGQLLTGDRAQNKLLVPLSRFVLQSRFEEVLIQANRRLARMSRGQFQLRRPALSRNLRDSQGLEIRVEDSVAGTERHAGSLSGGESFMAALSLALGLADVVQADLGGVKLDSVMIDEGFGTLDSESLDLAMKTLVDLQAGGRIVGIISHVQEIKGQIPHRLEVKKTAGGSEVLWNTFT